MGRQTIPGVLEVILPQGPYLPVVCDSPHSGDLYPEDFGHRLSVGRLRMTADAFVDELFVDAPSRGATLLRALFPRTYIDVNRSIDDLDASMLDGVWPDPLDPGPKVDLGIGLIARRDASGPLYDRKLTVGEVRRRIDQYYRPYHQTLVDLLDHAYRSADMVYHINCHSMRPVGTGLAQAARGARPIDFCLGDRDGTTSCSEFTQLVAFALRDMGYHVEVNHPYKGVELVRRYGDPSRRRSSLQIEVNRALYMDEQRVEKHQGFTALRRDMDRLLDVIRVYVEERMVLAAAAE